MSNNLYIVKIKASKAPEGDIRFKNMFFEGLSSAKNPTKAKTASIEEVRGLMRKGYGDIELTVVKCQKVKIDFSAGSEN